ncbi:protein NETWORKED 3C-like [Typha angustifolia]|uniref:protein NETWORKED 3C-like n=1 Tax=Typha angustifolia TaxID=59011 RepID=UPI003C2F8D66
MKVQKDLPQSWWFESHNNSRQSPWLVSTLSELEEKTKQMLKLIEEDADSFAQRAEMYYKKRPLLINLIGDFYRDHRSLAEQYDHLKSGGGIRHTLSGPSLLDRTWSQKVSNNTSDGSSLFSSDCYDSEESEVDDPEQEESEAETKPRDEPDKENDNDLVKLMKIELQILEEQNVTLKAELAGKDEEKREVIRQLASSIGILKEENADMRKCIKNLRKWGNIYELKKKTKELFSGKVFGGHSKSQTTVVAL